MSKSNASKPAASATKSVAAPVALYVVGSLYPVRANTARSYAQAQLTALAKKHPAGFGAEQVKQALATDLAKHGPVPAKGGWSAWPRWMVAQGWLQPVSKAKPSAPKAPAPKAPAAQPPAAPESAPAAPASKVA